MPIHWNEAAANQLKRKAEEHVAHATERAYEAASQVEGTNQKIQVFSKELKKFGIEPNMNTVRKLFLD